MKRVDDTTPRHSRVWELMPWVLNGTASIEERREVEAHLASCSECRQEFERQQLLQTEVQGGWPVPAMPDVRVAFAALNGRLDQPVSTRLADRPRTMVWWLRGLAAAVVVQMVALSVLGTTLWWRGHPEPAAVYRTLSLPAPTTPPATLRVVFAADLSLGDLQALLQRLHLQIVAGPTPAGVYSLAPAQPDVASQMVASQSALVALRAQPGVRFAEPASEPGSEHQVP